VNKQSGRVTTEGDTLYYEVRGQGHEPAERLSPQVMMDFLVKQELLPVTNYKPDEWAAELRRVLHEVEVAN